MRAYHKTRRNLDSGAKWEDSSKIYGEESKYQHKDLLRKYHLE
jgi:hypothetical protein